MANVAMKAEGGSELFLSGAISAERFANDDDDDCPDSDNRSTDAEDDFEESFFQTHGNLETTDFSGKEMGFRDSACVSGGKTFQPRSLDRFAGNLELGEYYEGPKMSKNTLNSFSGELTFEKEEGDRLTTVTIGYVGLRNDLTIDWLVDWLIVWWIDWLIAWLIDFSIGSVHDWIYKAIFLRIHYIS